MILPLFTFSFAIHSEPSNLFTFYFCRVCAAAAVKNIISEKCLIHS